jgi:hypothetical protein
MRNLISLYRTAFILLLSIGFLFASAENVSACKCVKGSLSKYYDSANAVVVAKVLEINERTENFVEIKIKIYDSWKTKLPETFSFTAAKTSCEYVMNVGEEYLLYLKEFEPKKWTTSQCMGNLTKKDSAAARKWLKAKGKKMA